MSRKLEPIVRGAKPLLEAIPIPISIVDAEGIVLFVNRAFLEFAKGVGREIDYEDRVGHNVREFFEEGREEFWKSAFDQVLKENCSRYGGFRRGGDLTALRGTCTGVSSRFEAQTVVSWGP